MIHLAEQSVMGAFLIVFIVILRGFLLHKLPKLAFQVMWAVVILRLLLPFSVPVPAQLPLFSEWIFTQLGWRGTDAGDGTDMGNQGVDGSGGNPGAEGWQPGANNLEVENNWIPAGAGKGDAQEGANMQPAGAEGNALGDSGHFSWRQWLGGEAGRKAVWGIWLVGAVLWSAYFITSHIRCRRRYADAIPVEPGIAKALLPVRFRRSIRLKISDRISSPLTYGLVSPVILLPKGMDRADTAKLRMVLEHESIHILRFDILYKWLMAAAVCLHWFNPFVWLAYVLAGRDMELSCDEAVVRRFENGNRQDYALALLYFEEQRGLSPLLGRFSGNTAKERIEAIMKWKKTSVVWIVLAIVLVIGAVTVFMNARGREDDSGRLPGEGQPGNPSGMDASAAGRLNAIWFDDFAVSFSADGQEKIYAAFLDGFDAGEASVPAGKISESIDMGYFAIYNNTIYYVDADVSMEAGGEVPDGKCRMMSCPLEAGDGAAVELFSLDDVGYLGRISIFQGLIFCPYETVDGKSKGIIADLETGAKNEIAWVEEDGRIYPMVAYDSEWIYYRNANELFRADYQGGNISLIHAFPQPVQLLAMAGEKFYAVWQEEEKVTLASLGKNGGLLADYHEFQPSVSEEFSLLCQKDRIYLAYDSLVYQIDEATGDMRLFSEISLDNAVVGNVSLKAGNEKHLYCTASYESEDGSMDNAMLLRIDLENAAKEVCRRWYMP